MDIRNCAIIAHVDHGKTTLVDALLKQSNVFRENDSLQDRHLIMDSKDQERERGITILAKNTAIKYKSTKINIIDTPGHADFGGEVERTLNMAEGALLIVDAAEGPMPQTRFVLKKALELSLKVIVVINKIDKKNADISKTIKDTESLFLEIALTEEQLEFPIYYAIGREGKVWEEIPKNIQEQATVEPLLKGIIKYIPKPNIKQGKFQMLVNNLDSDPYKGIYIIGKIKRGSIQKKDKVILLKNGKNTTQNIEGIYVNEGLKRVEVNKAHAGEIVAITGIKDAEIGDTLASPESPERIPFIKIQEPTMKIRIQANTSPFSGREGKYVTSRNLLSRINKELQTNVAMKMEIDNDAFLISGRGELHLSVFLEDLRREGYEVEVGKPQVITKEDKNGNKMEPIEELVIFLEDTYTGNITSLILKRGGILKEQTPTPDNRTKLVFEIPTRGLLGLRTKLMSISKGTAVINSSFLRFDKIKNNTQKLRGGVLIASQTGKASSYGLNIAQGRGITFISPGEEVYEGMIVGLNSKKQDLDINVTKTKRATNIRTGGLKDEGIILTPPKKMTLEEALNFIEEDELLELTPQNIRLRKKILKSGLRNKANRNVSK